MPLMDHFHPPLDNAVPWTTVLAGWVTRIADDLNESWLTEEFIATEIAIAEPGLELFEVRVFARPKCHKLLGVIKLSCPSNKDRPGERLAFAAKTAAYLHQGISVVIIDIVTSKNFNLHNDVVKMLAAPSGAAMADNQMIYAVSYRPTLRDDKPQIDLWSETLAVGQPLPTMPLRLTGDVFVPVQFESTYQETCRRRRLI